VIQLFPLIVNVIVVGLSFFVAGLVQGVDRFVRNEAFQYGGRLFVLTMALFGLIKAVRLFVPYYHFSGWLLGAVLASGVALVHIVIRRNSPLAYRIVMFLALALPVVDMVGQVPVATALSLGITGVTWFLYGDRRSQGENKRISYIIALLGCTLLLLAGGELLVPLQDTKIFICIGLAQIVSLFLGAFFIFRALYSISLKREFFSFACFFLSVAALAIFLLNCLLEQSEEQYIKNSRDELLVFGEVVKEFEARCLKELKLITSHPLVQDALSGGGVAQGLSLLSMELGASAIYIMDRDGMVTASSDETMVGTSNSSMPFFQRAIKGQSNIFFAAGKETGSVGVYFARPVIDQYGQISHVLVMKMPFERIVKSGFNALGAIFMNRDGAVLAGPSEMVGHTLFRIPEKRLRQLRASKIFANASLQPLGYRRIGPDLVISPKGIKYLYVNLPVSSGEWSLSRLIPYSDVIQEVVIYIWAFLLLLLGIVILSLKCFQTREWVIHLEREVSQRKRAEELQHLLTSIIEEGSEGVLITDQNGTIEYANLALSRITGYSADELIGSTPRLLKSGRHDSTFYKSMWGELVSGNSWHGRVTNRRKDGSLYEADLTVFSVLDEKDEFKYVGIQRDVTNEVQLERQLFQAQKMEAIGTLAGGVAHDFNNLLTAMNGYAEIGMMKLDPEEPARKFFSQILEVCQRASRLVKQLLIFSRQEMSEKVRMNLNSAIDDLMKMLKRLIGENITIRLLLATQLPDIMADPINIEQVMVNLVVNARDAMPQGGEITIRTAMVEIDEEQAGRIPSASAGRYVKLSVEDTGVGIPGDIIDKIFDPFFSTKGPGKGTGLGLSVVYSIVTQHDGWINVYSEAGNGTEFRIYFPVPEDNELPVPEDDEEVPDEFDGRGRSVLFIEDELTVREIGTEYLRRLNFNVVSAKDLDEARRLYDSNRGDISVIVSDIILPDGNGFEFIKGLNPECPVIFCTGYIDEWDIKTEIKAKGYMFIQKPYGEKDLIEALSMVLP